MVHYYILFKLNETKEEFDKIIPGSKSGMFGVKVFSDKEMEPVCKEINVYSH
jgi:hypothetical protein